MLDYKEFNRQGFRMYMWNEFSLDQFARELVDNILTYANKDHSASKDQFAYFVSDMIPEIEFGEVAAFCDDSVLTKNGIMAKQEFIDSNPKVRDFLDESKVTVKAAKTVYENIKAGKDVRKAFEL